LNTRAGGKNKNHMKKLAIAIAVLAAAIVSTGSFTHQSLKNAPATTLRADYPIPPCVPNCAINIPS
jgi:hypothetical protein